MLIHYADYLGLVAIENAYLEKITKQEFERISLKEEKEEIVLDLKEFNQEEKAIKARIIFLAIKKLTGTTNGISKIHIDDMIQLCQNNIGNKYLTPNKHIKIAVNKGKMSFFVTKKT